MLFAPRPCGARERNKGAPLVPPSPSCAPPACCHRRISTFRERQRASPPDFTLSRSLLSYADAWFSLSLRNPRAVLLSILPTPPARAAPVRCTVPSLCAHTNSGRSSSTCRFVCTRTRSRPSCNESALFSPLFSEQKYPLFGVKRAPAFRCNSRAETERRDKKAPQTCPYEGKKRKREKEKEIQRRKSRDCRIW